MRSELRKLRLEKEEQKKLEARLSVHSHQSGASVRNKNIIIITSFIKIIVATNNFIIIVVTFVISTLD